MFPSPLDVEVLPPVVSDCPSRDGMIGARLKDSGCFLIDARTVTRGQYYDALQRKELKPANHPACVSVKDFGPRSAELDPNCLKYRTDHDGIPQPLFGWPPTEKERGGSMACIHWCDALSFCESQGKRLCRGGREEDGSISPESLNDAARDEWFSACSAEGTRKYPYGNLAIDWRYCRHDRKTCSEGGYEGLLGMTYYGGDLTDNCDESGVCILRGRAKALPYYYSQPCDVVDDVIDRLTPSSFLTFRCCAD